MPELFRPDQWAVQYVTPKGKTHTLGTYDEYQLGLAMLIQLLKEGNEAWLVTRQVTPWQRVDAEVGAA